MKPRWKPSPTPWRKRTGAGKTRRECWASATRLCSTRCASSIWTQGEARAPQLSRRWAKKGSPKRQVAIYCLFRACGFRFTHTESGCRGSKWIPIRPLLANLASARGVTCWKDQAESFSSLFSRGCRNIDSRFHRQEEPNSHKVQAPHPVLRPPFGTVIAGSIARGWCASNSVRRIRGNDGATCGSPVRPVTACHHPCSHRQRNRFPQRQDSRHFHPRRLFHD